ncbi:MAG: retropepsin-like domain-containing protein [Saprospiraceae bacterium]|nr:retropepsin-like domain-containing protein [Saprospiraceae bacterium]
MLVDSGADISSISLEVGKKLGFDRFESEVVEMAASVNATVEYVLRNIEMIIEEHTFKAPIAWLLNPECVDILLGREVVFDQFNIEFRQKDEVIIFKKRDDI